MQIMDMLVLTQYGVHILVVAVLACYTYYTTLAVATRCKHCAAILALLHWQVHKEDPTTANSRVTIQADAEGLANGCLDSILGPVAVLSPSSMCSLTTAATAVTGDRLKDLGLFLQQLQQQQGRAMYGVDLPLFFSLNMEDFALTDAFFGHYRELQRIATREVSMRAIHA
jgi:hypothetical protein